MRKVLDYVKDNMVFPYSSCLSISVCEYVRDIDGMWVEHIGYPADAMEFYLKTRYYRVKRVRSNYYNMCICFNII